MLLLEECLTAFSHDLLEIVYEVVPHGVEGVVGFASTILLILHDRSTERRRFHLGNTCLSFCHNLVHLVLFFPVQTRRHFVLLLVRVDQGIILNPVLSLRRFGRLANCLTVPRRKHRATA